MNATTQRIENILTSQYSNQNYLELVNEIFDNMQVVNPNGFNKEFSNFSSHIEGSTHIGNYVSTDGKKVTISAVRLKAMVYVENSRSKQRSYAKKLIENAGSDAALIAFYTDGETKWRLSFVRLDYEMKIENGRLKAAESLTPAKRYSYLVGEGEPCHTAIDRLRIFIDNHDYHPSLDELEEAFSIEKVTEEFFQLYCEKFHQLREHLEKNDDFVIESEQHNFSSAQFAKKLMGQIVFLYFLQKKGWLGVSAWPKKLTEKEYKNAFYARGAKSRELIPVVYRPAADGTYVISGAGLESLDNADEAVLASCVKGEPWGTGPQNFMRKLFEVAVRRKENFYDDYLEPLFYEALNVNRGEQGYCPALHCRIPFLSGGLFEPIDGYEWEHNDFNIPNTLFSNRIDNNGRTGDGILDIFDRYNFTMSEDEPMEREVAIDPEMLGKVFENLLEVEDRKSKGAFYTPREIVHCICQESLINYLANTMNLPDDDVREFILYGDFTKDEDTRKDKREGNGGMFIAESLFKVEPDGQVSVNRLVDMDKALADVRVADPAVGSGAFPLGMLNEIVRARQNITEYLIVEQKSHAKPSQEAFISRQMHTDRSAYRLKYETVKNCIFAADIEPSAVDIAQLRLWLSLVIDDEINPNAQNPLDGHKNPLPLPNLESNILCGNSLSDEFAGIRLINESDIIGTQTDDCQIDFNQPFFEATLKSLVETQNELFSCDTSEKKESLKEKISELRDIIIMKQLEGCSSETLAAYEESKKQASKPYVLWRLDFARVFKMKKGFDIVIGNPPYVDSEEMTKTMPFDRELYVRKFNSTKGNWDLFVPFIENGINLLAKGGTISYIVPNKLISAPYAVEIRKIISTKKVLEIRDYSNVNVFKSAAVYPVVFRVCDSGSKVPVSMNVMLDMTQIQTQNRIDVETFYADVNWDRYFTSKAGALEIIEKLTKFPQLHTLASVNGAATVSEAYLVKEFLIDEQYPLGESKKFINTGGIDPYKSFYGKEYIRYLKGKYMYPIVSCSDLERMSQKRLTESNMPKIIIGGMTKMLECYYDKGEYLAGKSTTIVYNYDHLKYILAVLNSKLMTFYYQVFFNSMSLAGGFYRVGAPQVKTLPIAVPSDDLVIKSVEEKVDELQTILESQCEENDRATTLLSDIDSLIYQIYGLNKSEVTVIEEHQS